MLDPDYDDSIDEVKDRVIFYLGDEVGFLKVWDLTFLLETYEIKPCTQTYAESKVESYNPSRIEGVDVSQLVSTSLRKYAARRARKNPKALDPLLTRI